MENKLKLIKNISGISYYENPDKELVGKIQSVEAPEYFKIDYERGDYRFKEVQKNGKFIVETKDGDVKSVTEEDYNEGREKALINKINKEFSIMETFNKFYAPYKSGKMVIFIDDYIMKQMGGYFSSGVEPILNKHTWGSEYRTRKYYDGTFIEMFEFKLNHGYSSASLRFGLNGEIVNRDYNINFNDKKQEFISLEKEKETFIKSLKVIPEDLEFKEGSGNNDGIWFSESRAYVLLKPYLGEENIINLVSYPKRNNGYFPQGESSSKVVKPKKGLVNVKREHLEDALKIKLTMIKMNENGK